MKLGLKIRQLRKSLGLTQAELGVKAFNVSPSVAQTRVNRIEHGIKTVTETELNALKEALGVQHNEFLGLTDNYDSIEAASVVKTIDSKYPEMKSHRNMLAFAISQKDPYLTRRAWQIIQEYAQKQVERLLNQ